MTEFMGGQVEIQPRRWDCLRSAIQDLQSLLPCIPLRPWRLWLRCPTSMPTGFAIF